MSWIFGAFLTVELLRSFGIPESGLYVRHLSVAVSPEGDRIVTGNYQNIATTNGTVTESAATAILFPIVLSIGLQNGSLVTLNWSGGDPRYQVQTPVLRQSWLVELWRYDHQPKHHAAVGWTGCDVPRHRCRA